MTNEQAELVMSKVSRFWLVRGKWLQGRHGGGGFLPVYAWGVSSLSNAPRYIVRKGRKDVGWYEEIVYMENDAVRICIYRTVTRCTRIEHVY